MSKHNRTKVQHVTQENRFISSKRRDQLYVTLNQRSCANDVENGDNVRGK